MVPRVHSPVHFKDANYQSAQFIGLQAHGSMHIICSICDERSPSTAIAHSLCQFATMMLASLFRSGRHRLRNLQGLLLSQRSNVRTLIHDLRRPRPCRGVSRSTPSEGLYTTGITADNGVVDTLASMLRFHPPGSTSRASGSWGAPPVRVQAVSCDDHDGRPLQ